MNIVLLILAILLAVGGAFLVMGFLLLLLSQIRDVVDLLLNGD